MPRKPRMYLPGVPCHVIQRGNNRDACFRIHEDYRFYLESLGEACGCHGVALHAYVLMTNHVHLLMTPDDTHSISRVMQSLGRRYVQYFNQRHRLTGTLWESRHRASIIDAETYLIACYRYIELNPVRAGMVVHPADYPWSSYGHNAFGRTDPWVTEHQVYLALAESDTQRRQCYRDLFSVAVKADELHSIRAAATFGTPLGDERFKEEVQKTIGRPLGYAKRGRPRRYGRSGSKAGIEN